MIKWMINDIKAKQISAIFVCLFNYLFFENQALYKSTYNQTCDGCIEKKVKETIVYLKQLRGF